MNWSDSNSHCGVSIAAIRYIHNHYIYTDTKTIIAVLIFTSNTFTGMTISMTSFKYSSFPTVSQSKHDVSHSGFRN